MGRPRPFKHKRRRPTRHKGRKDAQGFDKVERIYLNLLEEHLHARRKYFELFHKADPQRLAQLERNFSKSARKMQEFAATVAPQWRQRFEKKVNPYRNDTTYSGNRDLPSAETPPPQTTPVADPHLLRSQLEADHSGDTLESVGTMDDYRAYKNL